MSPAREPGDEAFRTPAERLGLTAELARAAARLAAAELLAGRAHVAREILEGLAIANPHDAAPWAMLAILHRRAGRGLAARLCAETAYRLAPSDPQVRLVRAELLLAAPDDRPRGVAELEALRAARGAVGERAGALLAALGERAAG